MPQSTPQAAMLRGEEKTMIRELRWKLGIAPLQLGVIQSRAQNALRRARAALKEALHRARGGWTNVGAPPPWYAEKLIAHYFALDPRRDTPMRWPRCGATGRIEHGEHRRCGCGLAMAVSGNALKVWSAGVPHYATALDAEIGTTTVTEIERERAKDCLHPPARRGPHAHRRGDASHSRNPLDARPRTPRNGRERALPRLHETHRQQHVALAQPLALRMRGRHPLRGLALAHLARPPRRSRWGNTSVRAGIEGRRHENNADYARRRRANTKGSDWEMVETDTHDPGRRRLHHGERSVEHPSTGRVGRMARAHVEHEGSAARQRWNRRRGTAGTPSRVAVLGGQRDPGRQGRVADDRPSRRKTR